MKRLFILFILALSIARPNEIHAQGWQWASGCTGGSEGYGISVDPWGNVFTSGYSGGILTFGTVTLTGLGTSAAVVAKYDAAGNLLWANSTHNGFAKPINIASDVAGNLYLYGYYISPFINVGSFTLNNPGSGTELFLAKFTSSGSIEWAVNLCPGDVQGNIVVKGSEIYIAGVFDEPVITVGATTLTNADPSGTTDDILLIKTDTAGNINWAKRFGGNSDDNAFINIAPSGYIYMAGTSASPAISFGAVTLANTDTSLFIVRFDASFNALWAKSQLGIGKIGSSVGEVATDSAGDAYVCGSWRPAAYFGTQVLHADSVSNIFLVKYDSTGNISWTREVTSNGELGGYNVITDYCGNVWIAGGMGDQTPGHHGSNYVVFDSTKIDTPAGSKDPMFIAEYTTAGDYIKSALLPTCGDDLVSIGSDGSGNIYVGADYWIGSYKIGSSTLYDPVQPSENICVVKYVNNTADSTIMKNNICIKDSCVIQAPPGYAAYRWDDGSMQTTRTFSTPGTYKLYGTGKCGNGILLDVFIINYGQLDTAYAQTDTSICQHAQAVLSPPPGYTTLLWNNGSTAQNDTVSTPGTYWVAAIGDCTIPTIFDTFTVTQNSIDLAFTLGNDTAVCAPLLLTAPISGVTYHWQDGTTGHTDLATQTGLYYVTVSDQDCINTETVSINFPDLIQHLQDTIFCEDQIIQLMLGANVPPGASASWSTGSTEDSIFVNRPGTYWVRVTDDACSGADTMTVATINCNCGASFPTAFTPNGDGKNDTYYPIMDKLCDIYDYSFCIYNRWGNLVYVTHDPSAKWDGKFNGVPQDTGTYMYSLEYRVNNVFNKHLRKGDFILIR